MASVAFDGPKDDVPVAPSNDSEIRASFELVAGPEPMRDDELALHRESCHHIVGFSYSSPLVKPA